MISTTTKGKVPATVSGKSWLINPAMDFSFFIAAPLLIIPAFNALQGFVSLTAIKLGVLSISATGHHLPGFIRAYTDASVFRRFSARLILVPALLVLFAFLAAYFKLSLIFFVLITWSTWHGSMQILGFLRIYDAKAGFASQATARLDFWMLLTWFVQVVLWSPSKLTSVLSTFYLSGGPLIPHDAARYFQRAWLILTLAVTAAFLAQTAANWIRHRYFNMPKILCMVFSIGFWAYCLISVKHLIVGLILWEIFHDLQYNVFVWNYNRNRVKRNLSGSRIERFLFQLNWRKVALYTLCIAAYGSIGLLTQDLLHTYENMRTYENLLYQIGNVFAASALIHFYTDGFIWKVRDGKVRADLGVPASRLEGAIVPAGNAAADSAAVDPAKILPAGVASSAAYAPRSDIRHWALVGFFFLGAAGLGASEYFHLNAPGGKYRPDNLADLVPTSGYANFMKATRLQSEGHADSAIEYFDRAIRFDPNYEFSHSFIGELKIKTGDTLGAIVHYEKARDADPGDEVIRANLAAIYLGTGKYEKAEAEYRALTLQAAEVAEYPFQLALALLQMKKGLQAKPFLERTLELEPAQPAAWNYLGMVEQALGHPERAREFYLKALALDSTYLNAKQNLSALAP